VGLENAVRMFFVNSLLGPVLCFGTSELECGILDILARSHSNELRDYRLDARS
jgi:hypothetical protein